MMIATRLFLFLFLTACVAPLRAAEEDFPAVGKTYELHYLAQPVDMIWPVSVTIKRRGTGSWAEVEFEIRKPAPRNSTPSEKDNPPARKQTMWLNFGQILAAKEL